MYCDFCHSMDCVKAYPHPKIETPNKPTITFEAGEWASCADCAVLHEAGKIPELIEKAFMAPVNQKYTARRKADGTLDQLIQDFKYIYSKISRVGYYISKEELRREEIQ